MAKNRNDKNPVADSEAPEILDGAQERDERQERKPAEARTPARPARTTNVFTMFKPNQGKRVRLSTAIGAGLLLVGAWDWMYRQFRTATFIDDREWLAVLIPLAMCAAVGLVVWYLVGVKPTTVDFMVATESEMKKVTWSSRKEVWGATKVVIGMVLLLTLGLFIVDMGFAWFFSKIGVLRAPF